MDFECGQWLRFIPTSINLTQTPYQKSEFNEKDLISTHCVVNAIEKRKRLLLSANDVAEYITADIHIGVGVTNDTEFSHQYNIEYSYDLTEGLPDYLNHLNDLNHHFTIRITLNKENMNNFLCSIGSFNLDYISLKIPFIKNEMEAHNSDNFEMIESIFSQSKFDYDEHIGGVYKEGFIFNYSKSFT